MNKRKIVIVGTGMVGSTIAYTLALKNLTSEILLIDINEEKAEAEKLDILHGLPFLNEQLDIKVGKYRECRDADMVIMTIGSLNNHKVKTRLDLADKDSIIAEEVTKKVVKSGFKGIFLVVSNPLDIITYVVKKVSKFPEKKVLGTGTMLDTSRFKYLLGKSLNCSPKSIQAYILGEHGDSSFPVWSNCFVSGKQIFEYIEENNISFEELNNIYNVTRDSGNIVSSRKGATYYAISMCAVRIVQAIYQDEKIVFPVSVYLDGEYEQKDICIGVPAVIDRGGVNKIVDLKLTRTEKQKLENSANVLRSVINKLEIKE